MPYADGSIDGDASVAIPESSLGKHRGKSSLGVLSMARPRQDRNQSIHLETSVVRLALSPLQDAVIGRPVSLYLG